MSLLKMLFKLAVIVVAGITVLTVVGKIRQRQGTSAGAAAPADAKLSAAGFFLLKRDEAKNPNVVIFTPPNCPSHEAQRARALADSLRGAGIPSEMRQSLEVTFTDPAEAERVNKFMGNVANPLVLVRGWAKGSPTLDDVIAQYNAGK